MKRLAIISILFLITLPMVAQMNFDSTAYRAFRVDVHLRGHEPFSVSSDVLFYIEGNKMFSSVDNQFREVCFRGRLAPLDIGTGNETYFVPSYDNGGFKCTAYFVYTPAERTRSKLSDVYLIALQYDNVTFYFECRKTDDRPWDDKPKTVIDMIEEQERIPENPEYTDEEIDEFFMYLEQETGIEAKVAKTFIMNEFIRDIQE